MNTITNIDNKFSCLDWGGDWLIQDLTFDTYFKSLSTIFQMITTEGWSYIMFNVWDSRGQNLQPKKGFSLLGTFYILSCFFSSVSFF